MDVRGVVKSHGDFLPNGERLKGSLYRSHLLGVYSDDTDGDKLEIEKRELQSKIFQNFSFNVGGVSTPQYEHIEMLRQAEADATEGARIGRWIHVVGLRLQIGARCTNAVEYDVNEAPAGHFGGTLTGQTPQYFRVALMVERAGGTSSDPSPLFAGISAGSPGYGYVHAMMDATRSNNWSVIFDRKMTISAAAPAIFEEHFIDCDFQMEFSNQEFFFEAVTNKLWITHWENADAQGVSPAYDLRLMVYYYTK